MSKSEHRFSPFVKQAHKTDNIHYMDNVEYYGGSVEECHPQHCFVTCGVCCNIIGQGCANGFPGVLLPQLKQSGGNIPVSEAEASWIASVMAISIFFGNLASPPLMGRLGRKAAAYAVSITGVLGWTVIAFAPDVSTLLFGRIVQGVSYGIIMPLRPVMIGEYTSPRNRGSFLITISLSQTAGIGLVHFIGSLLRWQYTALVCCCFPLLSLVLTLYSPESPSWLALRGKFDQCRDAFRWLRGDHEEAELDKMIQTRIEVDQERNTAEKTSKLKNLKVIARKKEVYKPVILAMHVYLLAQFSGAITLANYTPQIIGALGTENGNLWMVELDILRLLTNILAVYVIAKIQRRTMMFTSAALCVSSHLAIAVYAYMNQQGYHSVWIPILLLNLQMASIGFGMVPMANVITGEIFPLEYRSILGMVSVVAVAATIFIVLKTFPGMLLGIGLHGTYLVYTGILVYGIVVTWFMLPETKGRTLQEIEEHFKGKFSEKEKNNKEAEPLKEKKNRQEELA